jgi:hypothetical protein
MDSQVLAKRKLMKPSPMRMGLANSNDEMPEHDAAVRLVHLDRFAIAANTAWASIPLISK